MVVNRRTLLKTGAASAIAGLAGTYLTRAQADLPLKIVSPFNAGGVNDVLARAIARPLSANLNKPVIIENRPGAGGSIGAGYVAQATPDGNTLLLGIVDTQSIIQYIYPKLPYDPETSLVPVTLLTNIPIVLMVGRSLSQVSNLKNLAQLSKSRPGSITYASWGGRKYRSPCDGEARRVS